jgi:hypothetical protein
MCRDEMRILNWVFPIGAVLTIERVFLIGSAVDKCGSVFRGVFAGVVIKIKLGEVLHGVVGV